MKKIYLLLAFTASFFTGLGQDSTAQKNRFGLYTFIVNIVPDNFKFPLIGFMNQAQGSHTSLQAGFINHTQKNFMGGQFGFINTTGETVTGMQAGFINTSGDSLTGVQAGFINMAGQNCTGAQYGFLNTAKGYVYGMQAGFVNTAGDSLNGLQAGFMNSAPDKVNGAQFGFFNNTRELMGAQVAFINNAGDATGAQIGFINTSKKVKGFQLGFINVADTVESGMPFGFLSIVRKGGFCAVDLGFSEMYPANVSLRVGIRRYYTIIMMSYNPEHSHQFAVGGGFGTIFPAGKKLYFNPEIMSQNTIADFSQQTVSLTANMGFMITPKLHVLAGPSVVWNNLDQPDGFYKPVFSLYSDQLDSRNRIMVGARLALRYNFKW